MKQSLIEASTDTDSSLKLYATYKGNILTRADTKRPRLMDKTTNEVIVFFQPERLFLLD